MATGLYIGLALIAYCIRPDCPAVNTPLVGIPTLFCVIFDIAVISSLWHKAGQ